MKMGDNTISYHLAVEAHTSLEKDQQKRRKRGIQQSEGAVPGRGRVHSLALRVVVLYKVLQQVHSLLGLDFINFNEILWKENRIA